MFRSLFSRKPDSTSRHIHTEPPVVYRYDIEADKFVPVTLQEAYDELHQFMNRYGSFLKLQKELWEENMHQFSDLPDEYKGIEIEEVKDPRWKPP